MFTTLGYIYMYIFFLNVIPQKFQTFLGAWHQFRNLSRWHLNTEKTGKNAQPLQPSNRHRGNVDCKGDLSVNRILSPGRKYIFLEFFHLFSPLFEVILVTLGTSLVCNWHMNNFFPIQMTWTIGEIEK